MDQSTSSLRPPIPLAPRRPALPAVSAVSDPPALLLAFGRLAEASRQLPFEQRHLDAMTTEQVASLVEAHYAVSVLLDSLQVTLLDELDRRRRQPVVSPKRRVRSAAITEGRQGRALRPAPGA